MKSLSRHAAVFSIVAAAALAAVFLKLPGETLFTGLDDSAQSCLARSLARDKHPVFRDRVFLQVPQDVRRDLLYRPAAARKTRDLAHQLDQKTGIARPFFQPFFPFQKAFLPGLQLVLALAVFGVFSSWCCHGMRLWRGKGGRAAFVASLALAAVSATPWHSPHYLFGPFAESTATLLVALALVLSLADGCDSRRGFFIGISLGFAVAFHLTLSAFAIPVAAFSAVRCGRVRHALALVLGSALGLAALAWSTTNIAAPYGNFLSPTTLRAMVAASPDIAVLVRAVAVALPVGVALVAFSMLPAVRKWLQKGAVAAFIAAFSVLSIAVAVTAIAAIGAARAGFMHDAGALAACAPSVGFMLFLVFAKRNPWSCLLLAALCWASVPFFVVQGNEVHVGLWSLRRALAPVFILSVALAGCAFERRVCVATLGGGSIRPFAGAERVAALVCLVCGAVSVFATRARMAFVPRRGDAAFCTAVNRTMDGLAGEHGANAVFLFDSFRYGAPFVSDGVRTAFCISDAVSKRSDPSRLARWMLGEALRGRPVFIGTTRENSGETIQEDGFSLVPVAAPVETVLSSVEGKSWRDAQVVSRSVSMRFMQVVPDRPETPVQVRTTTLDFSAYDAFPFGLRGGWAMPVRGKAGRWATDGAGFCAPVPPTGGEVEFWIEAAWTPPSALGETPQRLTIVPPFAFVGSCVCTLEPGRSGSMLHFRFRRSADDGSASAHSGVYRLQADFMFDADRFPERLAAQIFSIRSAIHPPAH